MIAILTDFGDSEYAGVVKGVIYSISKNAKVSDITNNVSPQNIREGAWILLTAYSYFPKGTVFLCVVDPSVGSRRKAIAIKTRNYFFVGPDNGLMFPSIVKDGFADAKELAVKNASKTFHGRDVFAKAAAKIEKDGWNGISGKKTKISSQLRFYKKGRKGEIVRIDSFGNVITNLEHAGKKKYNVSIGRKNFILDFFENYSEGEKKPFLVECSSDTLEIAVKNGRAADSIKVNEGDKIRIY